MSDRLPRQIFQDLEKKRINYKMQHNEDPRGIVMFVRDFHSLTEYLRSGTRRVQIMTESGPVWQGLPIYTVPFNIEPGLLI